MSSLSSLVGLWATFGHPAEYCVSRMPTCVAHFFTTNFPLIFSCAWWWIDTAWVVRCVELPHCTPSVHMFSNLFTPRLPVHFRSKVRVGV